MNLRAVNCLFLLFLTLMAVMLCGCASDEPENASVRPWNSPAGWQQNGALNGMDYQHR